jgi:protoporphyrinogen oxidase
MTENETRTTAPASEDSRPYVVLGGGPAGLTAGYLLAKRGEPVIVLEATDQVGGIARTEVREGPDGGKYRFDLGGHRFFTKVREVDDLWHEIMKGEFLLRPRMSRIYWRRKFLQYPLEGMDVIKKLGPVDLTRAGMSYLYAAVKTKVRPQREDTFEQWVSNRFGRWLFTQFFKTYTEKVWGVPTSELRADWAAQRIKGLSFFSAAKAAFLGNKGNEIRSLIGEFHYPRFGPGQMWERMQSDIETRGGEVRMNAPVTRILIEDGKVVGVIAGGETIAARAVISSLPLGVTTRITDPEAPAEVRDAGRSLRYRDFLTVSLVIEGGDLFPDNWIYIHEPGVRVGRIQNFRSWSPYMVPNDHEASIGLEYFCFEGDELWNMADDDLVELAKRELGQMGLGDPSKVKRGFAVRVHKAYPVYDEEYARNLEVVKDWLAQTPNLVQVGRNGLHRYNNSDHSMLTAMRAVDNLVDGARHDIWAVNAENEYHEEDAASKVSGQGDRNAANPYPYRDAPPENEREQAARASS